MRQTVIFSDNFPVVAVVVIAISFVLSSELEMGFMFWSAFQTTYNQYFITHDLFYFISKRIFSMVKVNVESPIPSNSCDQSRQEQIVH